MRNFTTHTFALCITEHKLQHTLQHTLQHRFDPDATVAQVPES